MNTKGSVEWDQIVKWVLIVLLVLVILFFMSKYFGTGSDAITKDALGRLNGINNGSFME